MPTAMAKRTATPATTETAMMTVEEAMCSSSSVSVSKESWPILYLLVLRKAVMDSRETKRGGNFRDLQCYTTGLYKSKENRKQSEIEEAFSTVY